MVLDLLMPDVSGFEVLRTLRSRPQTAHLPVLVYTSKPLSASEKVQLAEWNASIVRKEDVSSRLSAKPFLDWLSAAGLIPEVDTREQHA
jgi:CheY-like chemotaxis protein